MAGPRTSHRGKRLSGIGGRGPGPFEETNTVLGAGLREGLGEAASPGSVLSTGRSSSSSPCPSVGGASPSSAQHQPRLIRETSRGVVSGIVIFQIYGPQRSVLSASWPSCLFHPGSGALGCVTTQTGSWELRRPTCGRASGHGPEAPAGLPWAPNGLQVLRDLPLAPWMVAARGHLPRALLPTAAFLLTFRTWPRPALVCSLVRTLAPARSLSGCSQVGCLGGSR